MKRIMPALIILAVTTLCSCTTVGGKQARQFALEKRACAELGLDPGSAAFSQCAIDLDTTMFALNAGE